MAEKGILENIDIASKRMIETLKQEVATLERRKLDLQGIEDEYRVKHSKLEREIDETKKRLDLLKKSEKDYLDKRAAEEKEIKNKLDAQKAKNAEDSEANSKLSRELAERMNEVLREEKNLNGKKEILKGKVASFPQTVSKFTEEFTKSI